MPKEYQIRKAFMTSKVLSLLLLAQHAAIAEDVTNTAANAQTEPDEVEEILVFGQRQGSYTVITEDAEKLVNMPGALGDPLGAITALPGVLSTGGGAGPAVRGSSPNDNRYYIDDMPAGYIFHQFNTSIFDDNVVQDFQLYPAGFGTEYSNATGAIFDIRLRDPANQRFTTTVTASLLRAGVFFESGLGENSSFYLSARTGLLQYFFPEEDEANEEGIRVESPPEDNDYIFKYLWEPDSSIKLTVNFAAAQDKAAAEFSDTSDLAEQNPDFAGDASINDAFNSQSIRFDKTFGSGGQWVSVLSNYQNRNDIYWGNQYYLERTLEDLTLKSWYSHPIGAHQFRLGAEITRADYKYDVRTVLFVCTETDPDCGNERRDIIEDSRTVATDFNTLYLSDTWQIHPRFSVEAGLQWHESLYNDDAQLNPRLSLAWQWTNHMRLIASAGRYDRLPDFDKILPTIGNPNLESYTATHYTLGFEGDFAQNWTWSVETYLKKLENLPLAIEESAANADNLYSNDESGEARGIDLFLNRNYADKWYGWVSLSYVNSERTNDLTGDTQDYALDTPFIFNLVANYQLSARWNTGLRFTAHSGEATTEIIDIRDNPNPDFPDHYLPVYGEPYAERLPIYASLDLRFERDIFWFSQEGTFFIDILNALNRENIDGVSLDYEKVRETGELYLEKEAGMGTIFSLGFSLTF